MRTICNDAGIKGGSYRIAVKAAQGDSPAEILVHGPIGRSFWTEDGISGKEFTDALNKIPVGSKVVVGVNSQGGAVSDGLAIYNAIQRRAADVTVRIDGYALSIASFFPLAASKVQSPASALWMIHNVWSWMDGTSGNAEQMRKLAEEANQAADMLDKHDDVLISTYVDRTGKSENEIRAAMEAETWLTGAEAVEWGLADESSDNDASLDALDFSTMPATAFKRIPAHCRAMILAAAGTKPIAENKQTKSPQTGANQIKELMNKQQMLALLKQWGVEINDSMTDEQLVALVSKGKPEAAKTEPKDEAKDKVIDLRAEIQKGIDAEMAKVRRAASAREALAMLVGEKRITQAQAEKALPAILAESGDLDKSAVLAALKDNPVMPEPAEPVAASIEEKSASINDIDSAVKRMRGAVNSFVRGNNADPRAIKNSSVAIANIINANRDRLIPVLNANTISSDLQRNVILSEIMRAFATRILPLRAFSTVFENVPLQGTDKVSVPYYPLATAASTDWNGANGYVMGDSTINDKDVTLNKRKYQPIRFGSDELSRQPAINLIQVGLIKAEKLAADIFADVLSVVTAANYGAASFTGIASTFDSSDIADLKGVCDAADWPDAGRSLILSSSYDVNLLKDSTVKSALNFGSSDPIQNGMVQKILGFGYYMCPHIPANAENLVGMVAFPSAILAATAPVMPDDTVRNQLTSYDVVVHPQLGVAFSYRKWGNADFDQRREVIECAYGFNAAETAALKRMVSA